MKTDTAEATKRDGGRPGEKGGEKPGEPALVTALFSRRLAEPLARAAVCLGVGADAVTVAGGLCWVLSLAVAPAAGLCSGLRSPLAPWLWALAAALWCVGYELDVVDGSVARMTHSSSRAGFFLDAVFHALFKPYFLASLGIGLALSASDPGVTFRNIPSLVLLVLALLSVPANGAATTFGAEIALCEDVALGRLRPIGSPNPALWLGSGEVSDSAADKRATFRRALLTLARETLSYYLQAPFFALLVAVDLAFADKMPQANFGPLPVTAVAFAALAAVLIARIPVRWVRDSRRLGRRGSFLRASPIHARFARHSLARLLLPMLAVSAGLCAWQVWLHLDPSCNPAGPGFAFVLLPFLFGGLAFGAEKATAAHVLCEEVGKGRLVPGPVAEALFRAFFSPADHACPLRRRFHRVLAAMNPVARVLVIRAQFRRWR